MRCLLPNERLFAIRPATWSALFAAYGYPPPEPTVGRASHGRHFGPFAPRGP